MSQRGQHFHHAAPGNVTVSEVYWSLVDKADKKFSKIRDVPSHDRHRYDTYFYKVFKVYTQLWKFQQENRQQLVEAGLKRWEIGEIASRIAQLYFGQYMRSSEASYLSESYVFYEAIFTREYFREGSFQDLNLANKQMRFLARFLTVCLVVNKKEMVHQLVNQLKLSVDECRRTFQDADFKEWKLVLQEIIRFLKADTAFMNTRPLRYSLVLDPVPESLPRVTGSMVNRNLKLRDAILSSYYHNEVKLSELTLDTFRMLQCIEWEPSGLLYQPTESKPAGSDPTYVNVTQDLVDHTLPPNPRKAVLYRPTAAQLIAVLATICEDLPPDGIIMIYLSASGRGKSSFSSLGTTTFPETTENVAQKYQSLVISSEGVSSNSLGLVTDTLIPSGAQTRDNNIQREPCLQFGYRSNGGFNSIFPSDFLPFTRRPLLLVIDSESSNAFKAIHGAEKGEPAALLLSPGCLTPFVPPDLSRCPTGSLFTIFLTTPLQAFCILLGISSSNFDMDAFYHAEKLLSKIMNDWGLALATSDNLNPVWAQILNDPFLRRLLLRFLFCRAALNLYASTFGKDEFHPVCVPSLPESVSPKTASVQSAIFQLAKSFSMAEKFVFSEATASYDERENGQE
ncbi:hypothetical protein MLD38_010171 [Melastoma candidum]|uniref:Uncharacterized protein n=1 Tax=Melastoma candidum TaxID=119954 RepID=A0ACB9R7B9_9MYRT|nr:hypothetical protein MLD38_010171 [Melastoma candidum]